MRFKQLIIESDLPERSLKKIHAFLEKKYGPPIGSGRNRTVYGNNRIVVKVPNNFNGYLDNVHEHSEFKKSIKDDKYYPLARCKLAFKYEIPILFMERTTTGHSYAEMPDWAGFVDSGQVGRTKKGVWKAYDYGYL